MGDKIQKPDILQSDVLQPDVLEDDKPKPDSQLTVICPECGSDLAIDLATGTVLFHKPSQPESGSDKDFDSLLAGLDDSKARSEDIFSRELSALKDKDRLMEEKFEEALRRAEEEPSDQPPLRPWDLD